MDECSVEAHVFDDLNVERVVVETLEAYDAAIEDLGLLAAEANHDGTRLGAIRARIEAVISKWDLLRAIGALPPDLGSIWIELDAQAVARQVTDVLANHGVSGEVKEEIAIAIEAHRAEPAVIGG